MHRWYELNNDTQKTCLSAEVRQSGMALFVRHCGTFTEIWSLHSLYIGLRRRADPQQRDRPHPERAAGQGGALQLCRPQHCLPYEGVWE